MKQTIYYDTDSDPRNPGWVAQNEYGETFALDATDPATPDEVLLAQATVEGVEGATVRRKS